ncbi:MAG: DUF4143 domain-containing protein, partial [Spirochaetota bacterium]
FSKYSQLGKRNLLQKVFQNITLQTGKKVKYVNLAPGEKTDEIKKVLNLLSLAKIYTPVFHSSGNSVPLRGYMNEKIQKILMLDVGLVNSVLGYSYDDFITISNEELFSLGNICEQFIGQHLLYSGNSYEEPELYYWVREKSQSSAEVDYLVSQGAKVIPVEVKAGKAGRLKSLHSFLLEKQFSFALRFNSNLPMLQETKFSLPNTDGTFHLLSLPVYMVEEVKRCMQEINQ